MKSAIVRTLIRGKVKWQVNLRKKLTGAEAYQRRFFDTKLAATRFYRRTVKEIEHYSSAFARLTDPERAALAKFYSLLQEKNLSLERVVNLIQADPDRKPQENTVTDLTITDAIQGFMADCVDGGLEASTRREYTSHLTRFEKDCGRQLLTAITKTDLHDWLKDIGVVDRTRKNYITTLRTFFGFWVRQEVILKNPADLIRKPKDKLKSPGILTIEEISKFVQHILLHEPNLIAPMAVTLFAGVRTSEMLGLLWSDISLEKKQIHIRVEIAKKPKQRERWIKMTDNLHAWLSLCHQTGTSICEFNSADAFYDHRKKAFKKATGKPWPPNGARHSFASYTWTVGRDVKHLAKEMGNSPVVAQRFYIAGVEEEKGLLFLEVKPNP